jgi:CelD/BcsL family acetyltransferase involved in cellulose biosynthesis
LLTFPCEARTARTQTRSKPSRIAAIDILADLGQAETIWREFEERQQSHTPYQRFDFLASWQRQVGERDGLRPFVVITTDAERRPLLPLPLGRRHSMNIANFMGGKHSTFNMALWNGEFAATATRSDMKALISMIAQRREADVPAPHRQPLRWRDQPNPIALLPNAGLRLRLRAARRLPRLTLRLLQRRPEIVDHTKHGVVPLRHEAQQQL